MGGGWGWLKVVVVWGWEEAKGGVGKKGGGRGKGGRALWGVGLYW